ncbi:sodium-dependent transporter [Boudabousia marimammalium]|uniref:Sodium-dependent transporter n=1 Tax=Boudabousia marimammalium TaxID=156892 RepID=A0A1Q5PSM8_9ACTO|nr:sodium-dependent transporter [Boudabousia marimammalium]OKL50519.1 sodium-dependent transporter [Boudabousia marimammalium]
MTTRTKAAPPKQGAANGDRETWSSQTGFLLAAVGSAVGLGNIWRFPGVAYTNGGGAFMIPYLVALFVAGVSFLLLDYSLGHRLRGAVPTVFRRIHIRVEMIGWVKVLISFVIMTYYAVIIAWAAKYAFFSVTLAWGDDPKGFFFGEFLELSDSLSFSPVWGVALPLLAVWVIVIAILALGVQKGVERLNRIFLPLLVVLFAAVVIRSVTLPGAVDGLNAFFTPNWPALADGSVWLAAFSQIFFSLSIAFGIMVTYASYLPRRSNLGGTAFVAAFANSSFEILAGIGVFGALGFMAHQQGILVSDLEGITGVSLSFITFPAIIGAMPGGAVFGVLFFTSLVVAGLTSIVSLIQVVSAGFQDKFNWSPSRAAISVSVPSMVLSLAFFSTTSGLLTLDIVDKYINEVGVVFTAISTAVIVAVLHPRLSRLRRHLNLLSTVKVGRWWDFLIGFVIPAALAGMWVQTVLDLISNGYGGYPSWYTGVFGWGTLGLLLVGAYVLTLTRWRNDVDDFTVMPLPHRPRDRYGRLLREDEGVSLMPVAPKVTGDREQDDDFEYGAQYQSAGAAADAAGASAATEGETR